MNGKFRTNPPGLRSIGLNGFGEEEYFALRRFGLAAVDMVAGERFEERERWFRAPDHRLHEATRLLGKLERSWPRLCQPGSPILTRPMATETHHDEHHHVLEENRYLRTTIAEMRAAMESIQREKEQALRDAANESARETVHLRDTISALREQLENVEQEKSRAVQQAAADTISSVREYVAIIKAQREEMDRMVKAQASDLQQVRRDARDEHSLSEQTIIALREQLELHRDPS